MPTVNALLTAWLADMNASIDPFWQQNPFPAALVPGHLDLVLAVVTQQTVVTASSTALIAAIKAIPVANAAQLKALTVQQWMLFFLPANVALLPEFTNPGHARGTRRRRSSARSASTSRSCPSRRRRRSVRSANALSIPIADNDPFGAFLAAAPGFTFPVANWGAPSS